MSNLHRERKFTFFKKFLSKIDLKTCNFWCWTSVEEMFPITGSKSSTRMVGVASIHVDWYRFQSGWLILFWVHLTTDPVTLIQDVIRSIVNIYQQILLNCSCLIMRFHNFIFFLKSTLYFMEDLLMSSITFNNVRILHLIIQSLPLQIDANFNVKCVHWEHHVTWSIRTRGVHDLLYLKLPLLVYMSDVNVAARMLNINSVVMISMVSIHAFPLLFLEISVKI